MTGLDIFALIVLIVLVATGLVLWVMLGMYPGKIARQRNHPQAEAFSVCGWWGAITLGILSPLAFIWACINPAASLNGRKITEAITSGILPQASTQQDPSLPYGVELRLRTSLSLMTSPVVLSVRRLYIPTLSL